MKKFYLTAGINICISLSLFAQDSIVLKFTSVAPLDSICIENLVNRNYRVLKGADSIVYLFPSEVTVDPSTSSGISNEQLIPAAIFPNPSQGRTYVEFHANNPAPYSLSIYNLAGKLISGSQLDLDQGTHRFLVSLNSPGIYICRITDQFKIYSSYIFNTGYETYEPAIDYAGVKPYQSNPQEAYRDNHEGIQKNVRKLSPAEAVSDSTAKVGDLLRITGYSSSESDVIYDYLRTDKSYEFIPLDITNGTYLLHHDTLLFMLDTIRCFATSSGYQFAYDKKGKVVLSNEILVLKPATHGGNHRPVYSWEIENPDEWTIDTTRFSSGILSPRSIKVDTSKIWLKDIANEYEREYVLVMIPDDFIGPGIVIGEIQDDQTLGEISGIAASEKNPGTFWVHNDSGDEARIFLINAEGYIICTVNIDTDYTDNRDWEDICLGPGPIEGETYIYIGEIGDNSAKYQKKYIFRIVEPEINMDEINQEINIVMEEVSAITFDYHDGARDAETLMIDPYTADLYIVTKREDNVHVYQIPYPQNFEEKIFINKSIDMPFSRITAGDISPDGREILIKKPNAVFYWKLQEGETILDALSREKQNLPYITEPQGEAIGWLRDGSGYITISEKNEDITPKIYLYKRKW